jgi:thioredoxin:protein disulfide reductase
MRAVFTYCSMLLICGCLAAQPVGDALILTGQMTATTTRPAAGSTLEVAVDLDVSPGLHINSHTPSEDYLIATELSFLPDSRFRVEEVVYPAAETKTFSFSERPLSVYEGRVQILGRLQLATDAPAGPYELTAVLSYQGCNDKSCFAPQADTLRVRVDLAAAGSTESSVQRATDKPAAPPAAAVSTEEARAAEILQHGLAYALVAFFLVGLALNLTPCVYPIIPITVSYFGGQSERSRSATLVSALFYLLGIALSFALLGLLSSLAGRQWGFLFASPWFVVAITTIMLLMAASMFGAFEISVPSALLNKFGSAREGVIGSLIMGLTVGVIIAPCAAGIIIGLVSLVARMGLVVKGALLFFAMGLGLGLPYLVLATFSGLLSRLPQSGEWMIWVKKLFGFLLLGVAFYFLAPQVERVSNKFLFLAGITAIVGGLLLGWFDHTASRSKLFKIFKQIMGAGVLLLGLFWTQQSLQAKSVTLSWTYYSGQSMEEILSSGKPVFIDFYADWCAPCKQLDDETFSDSRVAAQSEAFFLLKVDCTKPDAATRAFMSLHQVSGMPTLVFIRPDGQEISALREIGFINADALLASMGKAL